METIISYSRRDRSLLQAKILPALKQRGVKVWTDDDVPPGQTWFDWFSKKIEQVDVLTILFSESYSRSGQCDEERKWIINSIMKTHAKRLAVIWRSGTLPAVLETTQAIDVRTDFSKLDQKFEDIFPVGPPVPEVRARPVPLATIDDPRDLPLLAQVNFDRQAPEYMKRLSQESMQGKNAIRMLNHYLRCKTECRWPKPESLLDVGCGTGLVLFLLRTHDEYKWLHEKVAVRAGVDYSSGMLQLARTFEPGYTSCFVCDVKELSPDRLDKEIGCRRVGLILANNVFHWLFTRDSIESSWKACQNVMTDGGVMVASVAGVGTGSLFLDSYRKVLLAELIDDESRGKWAEHLNNPIGLQSLDGLVDIARLVGLDVMDAQLVYEPVRYSCTDAYVADARVYGEDVFMAPLGRYDQQARNRVWTSIKDVFRADHFRKFKGTGYVHDQFMIYLILSRVD